MYLEAGEKYTTLVLTSGRKRLLRLAPREVALELAHHGFVRVHRSTVVNLRYLTGLGPTAHTVQVGAHTLPLGRAFKDELLQHVKHLRQT